MSDEGSGAPTDGAPADTSGQPNDTDQQAPPPADTDGTDYKALVEKAQAEAEKWRSLARKHEERGKSNAEAAARAKTLEEQVAELRKAMAERDQQDITRSARMARTQVEANLVSHGFNKAAVAELLEMFDPVVLLTDGEPDDTAIDKLTKTLIKVGGRSTPDPDQGKRGGTPTDMNTLIRRAAGVQ